jgi:hypothetical protein
MLRNWLFRRPCASTAARPQRTHLGVEVLEERSVPAVTGQTPFFLDWNGQLHAVRADGSVVGTGGWGISVSVGKDASGVPMAVMRAFNGQVFIYDQGTWIDTGGWARQVIAGVNGAFFARDYDNLVYRYQIGVGWNIATSPGTNSGAYHYAVQMSLGQQTSVDPVTQVSLLSNVLYIRTPTNHIEVYNDAGTFDSFGNALATFTDTGGFGQDIAAGYQGEVFVRDMNSRLYIFNGSTWMATGAWAFSLDVGQVNGSDYLTFKDANSRIYVYETATGQFIDTQGYAVQVAAGANVVYIRDFDNDVHSFNLETGFWTDLEHVALQINAVSVDPPRNPAALGELWGVDEDPTVAGHLFFFDGTWQALNAVGQDVKL